MSLPPVEIPLGAMRFNSDSQKLEYWNGDVWMQIHTETVSPIGGRYLQGGGWTSPADTNVISYVNTSTKGNAVDFGDLMRDQRHSAALANNTRGIFVGGYKTSSSGNNAITYVTIATAGDAADFGDALQASAAAWSYGTLANQTRGIIAGDVAESNIIQYITISSTGNATDFGDALAVARDLFGCATPTRGVFAGGSPSNNDVIQYITIASEGNSVDFGNLTTSIGGATYNKASATNGVVGLFGPGGGINIERITMTTLGNAQEFGSSDVFTTNANATPGSGDKLNMFIGSGRVSTSRVNTIETISFTAGGKTVDFGDATGATESPGACCNAHGGLG